ncbi:hypothetical protein XELAEV_18000210mg [Xenopus laevis]|uniref:Xenopsin n=1 Tax=Xenopus laevis TaxID=8355 RepID=A0A974BQQ4_XENLA|nr:hypothetical protein XELAEV_18000210mg [Xenopus laevis]
MYKGIFLCVLLAVICANSLATPSGYADEDNDEVERYVRGWASKIGQTLGKIAKVGLKELIQPKREAMLRSAEAQGKRPWIL